MSPQNESPRRKPRKDLTLTQPVIFALYLVLLAGAAALVVLSGDALVRAAGIVSAFFVVATFPMALKSAAGAHDPSPRESFDRVSKAIDRLTFEGGLSETAKRIMHRKEERELLRTAIEQDIHDGDYDAAMILAQELAERFGYRADAEEFRARIERVRAQTLDREVIASLEGLDSMVRNRLWTEAFSEASRITRLYPDSHRIQRLRERVDDARTRYKTDLERRFLLFAQREQVDEAMKLLKELDQYLSENEAEPFREVARGVIGKARDNLGVRFKLAVQDRAWADALDVGERIIAEFPNSRMAQEAREMLDTLRERAEGMGRSAVGARG